MILRPSQISTNDITSEQIGKCYKCFDCQTKENFYRVENEAGNFDDQGKPIEYTVRYSHSKGFTCTCKAGQNGRLCKHVRWSLAAAKEERQAMAEIAQAQAQEAVKPVQTIEQKWNIPAWMMKAPGKRLVGEYSY